jgi:hypothetical protein
LALYRGTTHPNVRGVRYGLRCIGRASDNGRVSSSPTRNVRYKKEMLDRLADADGRGLVIGSAGGDVSSQLGKRPRRVVPRHHRVLAAVRLSAPGHHIAYSLMIGYSTYVVAALGTCRSCDSRRASLCILCASAAASASICSRLRCGLRRRSSLRLLSLTPPLPLAPARVRPSPPPSALPAARCETRASPLAPAPRS